MKWKYVSVAEMVAIEKEADASGLSYAQMMENAGAGLANVVAREFAAYSERGVLGWVGSGNNGGDTLVALAHLAQRGWRATAYLIRQRAQDDPLITRLQEAGGKLFTIDNDPDLQVLGAQIRGHAVLLDGILGTGIKLPVKPDLAQVMAFIREAVSKVEDGHVVAVDCPSGVDCDTGEAPPECIPAELTVTMAAIKQGLLHFPAYQLAGRIELVGIGLGEGHEYPEAWEAIRRVVPDAGMVRDALPERPLNAHKGTFGTALIVAGSINYTGAAWLAGRAAYKSGAGLVTMAVPQSLHTTLAGQFPEATWLLLPDEMGVIAADAGAVLRQGFARATALLVGPGFGTEETTRHFIDNLFSGGKQGKRSGMGLVPAQKIGRFGGDGRSAPAGTRCRWVEAHSSASGLVEKAAGIIGFDSASGRNVRPDRSAGRRDPEQSGGDRRAICARMGARRRTERRVYRNRCSQRRYCRDSDRHARAGTSRHR